MSNIDLTAGKASSVLPVIGLKKGVHAADFQEEVVQETARFAAFARSLRGFLGARECWRIWRQLLRFIRRNERKKGRLM